MGNCRLLCNNNFCNPGVMDISISDSNMLFFSKETSNKDLSTLAKAAFELLKWRVFWEPHIGKAVSVILSSAVDTNWRTRSATLTYLRTFMYR